jgi:hypothetical protein
LSPDLRGGGKSNKKKQAQLFLCKGTKKLAQSIEVKQESFDSSEGHPLVERRAPPRGIRSPDRKINKSRDLADLMQENSDAPMANVEPQFMLYNI